MQMNNIKEAKFLLQAVSAAYKNRKIDDSFAKSYERAFQMLTEIESQSQSASQSQLVDKEGREQPFGQNSAIDEQKKGSYTKNRKEKWSLTSEVVSYSRQRFLESPDPERRDMKIPHTEPKRCSWGFNNGYQNKPSFERPLYQKSEEDTEKVKFGAAKVSPASEKPSVVKKSWADMAEEEEEEQEQELFRGRYTGFDDECEEVVNNENWNSNIMYQKLETFDLKDNGCDDNESEFGSAILLRNPTVRRSLCFNQQMKPESSTGFSCSSPKKASDSEGQRNRFEEKTVVRRNRLQVFQDITLHPGTP